jgi:ABC-type lipoprotein export system ATPase subunit
MSEDSQAPAIELVEVTKHFDGGLVKALDGLSLRVEQGESVAVTGPSGCGKSTMLHLIAALDRPTSGSIRVGGNDLATVRDLPAYRRHRVGLIFQLHNLLPQLSAIENIEIAMFGTELSLRERRRRAEALLEDVGLGEMASRLPTKMSGGERQRVAIARALANEPPLVLADEPTGSLDEASVERVLALFDHLREERPNLTLLIVTHDARVASRSDRIIRLRNGRVADGTLEGANETPPNGSAEVDRGARLLGG